MNSIENASIENVQQKPRRHRTKITAHKIESMNKLRSYGVSNREIADIMEISPVTVVKHIGIQNDTATRRANQAIRANNSLVDNVIREVLAKLTEK